MSDGATVKRMPLLNVLVGVINVPPTTVSVIDATDHMRAGGKKDARFVCGYMEETIVKYDSMKLLTDVFFFDGASNVQKGGQILEVIYPRSYSLHGGEHVVSLFFNDLAKLPQIKVCSSDSLVPCCCNY
jgi:hypothetical protein